MPLIDRFIPDPDVRDEHHIDIHAPADLVMDCATRFDMQSLTVVRGLIWLRGRIMHDAPAERRTTRLLDELLDMGWGLLAEVAGREIIGGAAAQPWLPDVKFRAIAAEQFAAFAEPDLVKIVWTLEAQPVGPTHTRFVTETRVKATDAAARRKFRRYWRLFSPGIVLIRVVVLRALKRATEAAYQQRTGAPAHAA